MGSRTLWYTGSIPEPSGTSSRWKLHSDAYPACSARTAKRARFSGVAQAPETGAPKPILMSRRLVVPLARRKTTGSLVLGGGPLQGGRVQARGRPRRPHVLPGRHQPRPGPVVPGQDVVEDVTGHAHRVRDPADRLLGPDSAAAAADRVPELGPGRAGPGERRPVAQVHAG